MPYTDTYSATYLDTYGVPSAAVSLQLPGNLLSPADCDFEAWTGNWTAGSNTAVAQSSAQAFTGSYSMSLTAAASGAVSAVSPYLPAIPSAGYIASGYLYATAAGRTGSLAITFYNSSHASLGTVTGTSVALANGAFTPVTVRGASPAGTAWVKITAAAATPGASEVTYFDLAYAALSWAQFLAAWYTQPSAATPVWADITPFVRADRNVSITRGRADEVSEVPAGKHTFTVDNTLGWFTVANPASPWYPGVKIGRRVQCNRPDETGAWHTRADMYLTDLPVTWEGGGAQISLVQCAASGFLAKVARYEQLRTMLEQEILLDAPSCFYALADASAATSAADSSGNGAAPLLLRTYGTGGTLTFGNGAAIVEAQTLGGTSPVTSIACTPVNTGSSPALQNDVQLEGYLPSPVTAAQGFTFEVWSSGVLFNFNTEGATWWAASLGNPRTGQMIGIRITGGNAGTLPGLQLAYTANQYAASPAYTTVALSNAFNGFPTGQPSSFVFTVSGTTASLYYQDTLVGTMTVPASLTATYLTVGGPLGGNQGWQGSLNCAAVFPSVVNSTRLSNHWAAGFNAYYTDFISVLMTNVARYSGIPSWAVSFPGLTASRVDSLTLSGQTPLAALQLYEQTDGGVLYETAAGVLAYQDRTARYAAQAAAAATLVLPAGLYEPDFSPVVTDQFLVNDAAVSTPKIPGGARAVNQQSVADYGVYPSGTPQSPASGPYYSFPNSGVAAGASSDVIADAASYVTGTHGTPGPRTPKITVDLLTGPGDGLSKAAVYAAEIGMLLNPQGLPSQMPGGVRPNFMLVEGMTETFSISAQGAADLISFNTSPSMQSAAWIAGDSAMGVLDSTAVVGRGSDGNSGGFVGPPYPVPAFSPSMNLTGNVGANDMRGLAYNVQQQVTPPCAMAVQVANAQSIPNQTTTQVIWDTLLFDTANGWHLATGAAFYTVPVAGVYLLMACVVFLPNATGDRNFAFWQNGAQINPGQEDILSNGAVFSTGVLGTATVTAAVGDQLLVTCYQSSGGALSLQANSGGSCFSILFLGA